MMILPVIVCNLINLENISDFILHWKKKKKGQHSLMKSTRKRLPYDHESRRIELVALIWRPSGKIFLSSPQGAKRPKERDKRPPPPQKKKKSRIMLYMVHKIGAKNPIFGPNKQKKELIPPPQQTQKSNIED